MIEGSAYELQYHMVYFKDKECKSIVYMYMCICVCVCVCIIQNII